MMKTEIKEYSETALALDDLTTRLSIVPDYETKEGYAEGEKGRKELKGYRIALDKKRKELGVEARKHLELINGEAKRINTVIVGLETPFIEAKQAIDDEKERIKAEKAAKEEKRVLYIETEVKRIHELSNCPRTMEAINQALSEAEKIDPNDGFFEEFMPAAKIAKDTATVALQELRDEAQLLVDEANRVAEEAEKQADEQKRLDAEREAIEVDKKAAQDKLDAQRAEMDKKQKAMDDQQAEIDRQEQAKKDAAAKEEQDLIDKEKAEQQAKEDAELEKKGRKKAAAKILADKGKYENEAKILNLVLIEIVSARDELAAVKMKTDEGKAVVKEAMTCITNAIQAISTSPVVLSQQTTGNENE